MNPYVQFAIAMCFVVFIALCATAYLAMMFTRRAKVDLQAALEPLARVIDGSVDLEEATVSGTYRGHLAFGRVTSGSDGPGRVFQTDVIDAAGGASWTWTTAGSKSGEAEPSATLAPDRADVKRRIGPELRAGAAEVFDTRRAWGRIAYGPDGGHLRFERPMQTRRDIPDAENFQKQLDLLVRIGPVNREIQGAPDAEWTGGRRAEPDDGTGRPE